MMLIGLADDLEEQFGSCLGKGDISKFINPRIYFFPPSGKRISHSENLPETAFVATAKYFLSFWKESLV